MEKYSTTTAAAAVVGADVGVDAADEVLVWQQLMGFLTIYDGTTKLYSITLNDSLIEPFDQLTIIIKKIFFLFLSFLCCCHHFHVSVIDDFIFLPFFIIDIPMLKTLLTGY